MYISNFIPHNKPPETPNFNRVYDFPLLSLFYLTTECGFLKAGMGPMGPIGPMGMSPAGMA